MTKFRLKTNLNCASCVAAVKPFLDGDHRVTRWNVDTTSVDKPLTVDGEDISVDVIRQLVSRARFEVFGELPDVPTSAPTTNMSTTTEQKSWWATYRPLLLVLIYLLGIVAMVEINSGSFDAMRAMRNFMGGFFVAFSFFKMLDLRGFADAFQSYDLLARSWPAFGFAYPFIELGLGAAYVLNVAPLTTNLATIAVMLVGLAGVSKALLEKRKIRFACLGTVFNLPMSTVTFVEDAAMLLMAAGTAVAIWNA